MNKRTVRQSTIIEHLSNFRERERETDDRNKENQIKNQRGLCS